MTPLRVLAALLAAAVVWMLWPTSAGAKGLLLGRDVQVTCDAGDRATVTRKARKSLSRLEIPGNPVRPRPTIVGCASLRNGAGTVQLSAVPDAPFRGCVLDSYTAGRRNGGIVCAPFSRAFTAERRVVGLWITRLAFDGPSVALGATAFGAGPVYLWYSLENGIPGVAPALPIPVDRRLAERLGAPGRLSYFAAGLPPGADLCRRTLIGGLAPDGPFGPAPLFTGLVSRTEGAGLTPTPGGTVCMRRRAKPSSLTKLVRNLNSTLATLVRGLAV